MQRLEAATGSEDTGETLRLRRSAGAALRRTLWLCRILLLGPRPDVILVQNPPAVPTLLVGVVAARLRRARLVVDWHNFGASMLALHLSERHPLVRVARAYEKMLGRLAHAHLCVSVAMQSALRRDWGVGHAVVLYDRPQARFTPTPLERQHELFSRLDRELGARQGEGAATSPEPCDVAAERTLRTLPVERTLRTIRRADPAARGGDVALRPDRPALLVCPTSFTADEELSMLLDAARHYDAAARGRAPGRPRLPSLLFTVTGRGPLRRRFEQALAAESLVAVRIRTLWLGAEDYPLLLGAADLGLCFHRSASGVDLPMKIADMFGAAIPVCALDYGPCLAEQLRDGENGVLFSSATELSDRLVDLLAGFPDDTPRLDRLRTGVAAARRESWSEAWERAARPLVETS